MSSNTGACVGIIAELRALLVRLAAVDLTAMSDAALVAGLRELRPAMCQAQAVEHRLVGAVHARGATRVEGAVSTTAWLRNRLHVPDATVLVRSAAALDRLPGVAEAFAAGTINDAHVAAIAKVARDISPDELAGGAEELLVRQAKELAPSKFVPVAGRIRDHLDPEAADRRRRERLESRWLSVARTFEGTVAIRGLLDPDAGELLMTTLATLQPPPAPDDPRTASTRRADALLDLCRLAAGSAPVAGGEKPHVVVTVDLDTLRGKLGQAELGSGWPIGAATARRLACDAGVIPMVLGGPSEPLDIGRISRTVPPALRRALVHRDGGCRFPGCDRPPQWTDGHHVVHWAAGGPTALSNLVLLCRFHHTRVHEDGWWVALEPDTGRLIVRCPDRTLLGVTESPRGGPCYSG